jgi:hypothetical protein
MHSSHSDELDIGDSQVRYLVPWYKVERMNIVLTWFSDWDAHHALIYNITYGTMQRHNIQCTGAQLLHDLACAFHPTRQLIASLQTCP